jgi:hypothetical protein
MPFCITPENDKGGLLIGEAAGILDTTQLLKGKNLSDLLFFYQSNQICFELNPNFKNIIKPKT